MADLTKVSIGLSMVAILLGAASLAITSNATGGLSNFSSQATDLTKKLGTLTSQLEAVNKNTELIAQATGIPLGNPAEVQRIIERRRLIEAAKAEGRVVLYYSGDIPKNLEAEFERLYPGVDLQFFRSSSTAVLDRVLTEVKVRNPQFDIVLTFRPVMLIMKKEGAFTKYISPEAKNFVEADKDPDGVLQPAFTKAAISILYNTKLVKPEEAPKSVMDLLNPKWKDKIVMGDPAQHTTTTQWLFSLKELLGPQWEPFIKGLAKQNPLLVKSMRPAAETIVRGEKAISIGHIRYVQTYAKAPIDYVRLDTVLGEVRTMGLGAQAKHPNAAKLLIDFLLSREGLKMWAEGTGEIVSAVGIPTAIKDADKLKIVSMEELTEEQFAQWGKTFNQWVTGG